MLKLPFNIWLLTIAQALIMSISSMVVFIGGLIGAKIAPEEKLATMPAASIIVGTAIMVLPVNFIMKKIGRKKSILIILICSIFFSLLAFYAVERQDFYLLCVSTFLFGLTIACVMQFRFMAMESVERHLIPQAASAVLLGGIAAAFIGPELAVYGKHLMNQEFSGSFLLIGATLLLSILILLGFKAPVLKDGVTLTSQRTLREISSQALFWVAILSSAIGYAVMSFIMTATPVSMHMMDGLHLQDTKWVIQSHIVAMFIPSVITPYILRKLGMTKMLLTGLIFFGICISIAYGGHALHNYWISLILLGMGWNFLFIGGTTLLPQSYTAGERFKVQAINDFVVFGAQAIAALSAGWIVFSFGWEIMLVFTLPLIIFLAIVILRWSRLKEDAQQQIHAKQ